MGCKYKKRWKEKHYILAKQACRKSPFRLDKNNLFWTGFFAFRERKLPMEEKKELLDQDERVVEIELERLRGFVNHAFDSI